MSKQTQRPKLSVEGCSSYRTQIFEFEHPAYPRKRFRIVYIEDEWRGLKDVSDPDVWLVQMGDDSIDHEQYPRVEVYSASVHVEEVGDGESGPLGLDYTMDDWELLEINFAHKLPVEDETQMAEALDSLVTFAMMDEETFNAGFTPKSS